MSRNTDLNSHLYKSANFFLCTYYVAGIESGTREASANKRNIISVLRELGN